MKYSKIVQGKFIERPNRFIAYVDVDGEVCKCHVKNTGRCKEILVPGARVYLEDFSEDMKNRKLRYSLIGVKKVCDSDPQTVADIRGGRDKAIMALFGRCMKELKGNCDPQVLRKALMDYING